MEIMIANDHSHDDAGGSDRPAEGNVRHKTTRISPEEARRRLRTLPLSDNFMFSEVMRDPEICRRVLEKILTIPILQVNVPQIEDSIRILPDSKGVRLDVYVDDDKGTVYDVEMQTGHRPELPKRMRYYQGNIDLDLICRGERYQNLHRSFVIFICTFDPFSDGRHIYTFENICRENRNLCLGDETVKILLNTRGTMNDIDEELKAFLTYAENSTDEYAEKTKSQLVRDIHERVRWVRMDRRTEVRYMTWCLHDQDIRDDALEEGRAEGRAEARAGALERAAVMLSDGMSEEQVVRYSGFSLDEIRDLKAGMPAQPM